MEGCYRVVENVNFENFLKVLGVPDDETIKKMMQASTQVMKLKYLISLICSILF